MTQTQLANHSWGGEIYFDRTSESINRLEKYRALYDSRIYTHAKHIRISDFAVGQISKVEPIQLSFEQVVALDSALMSSVRLIDDGFLEE